MIEDLLVEYYEDYFEEEPGEARKALSDNGEFIFTETGDPLLDKWEAELAKGLMPDLEEGYSKEQKKELQHERAKYKSAQQAATQLIHSDPRREDKYASKYATPGSKEEQELLRQSSAAKSVLGVGPSSDDSEWVDLLGTE